MAIKAYNYRFNQNDAVPITAYNPNKTNIGSLMRFYSGPNPEDRYVGPARISLARPMEQSVAIPGSWVSVIRFSNTINWVFLADGATATVTRRTNMYEHNTVSGEFIWKGFVTVNYIPAGNKTVRGERVIRDLYSVGTVNVSGTSVTGSGAWRTAGMCVGNRIGFGSTDPSQITTWHEISSINSDTSITLTASAGNLTNVPYVIEDLRIVQMITNSTTTNGGLFVTKGLRIELFNNTGTAILGAGTVDNTRASYWLGDFETQQNIVGYGVAIDDRSSWTDQRVYVINATAAANSRIFVYNIRTPLNNLVSGRSTEAYVLSTGNQATTGNITASNNGILATAGHGPGNGIKSFYWVTASRVYRTDISSLSEGSTTFQTDVMTEVPPGGTSTYAATATFSSVLYAASIDKFVILNTGATGNRSYCTEYNTTSNPFAHIFLSDSKQLDQSTADSSSVVHPTINTSTFSGYEESGILYLIRATILATTNQLYTLPIGAHQTYAFQNNQLIITPKFNVSSAVRLYEMNVNNIRRLGSDTFAMATEPFRIFYRTSGIDDNTGTWTQMNDANNLEGVSANEIQFAFSFRILGTSCIPARLVSMTLVYEDMTTDSRYIPSVSLSSIPNRVFAYRQTGLFIGNIPALRIRLYNADTGVLVIDDNTSAQAFGNFQYSENNGATWLFFDPTKNALGNYIRYSATSLPAGVKIKALLTL
jgi:hypothetical protein